MKKIGIVSFFALLAFFVLPWHQVLAQGPHGIQWSWGAVTQDTAGNTISVDGYNIYCSTSQAGPFTTKTNAALISTSAYLQTGLTVGSTYFCQVTAVKNSLPTPESAHSVTSVGVTFQFPLVAPGIPQGVIN